MNIQTFLEEKCKFVHKIKDSLISMLYAERDYREWKRNIFCFKIKSGYVGKDGVVFDHRHANQLLLFVF